MTYYSASVQKVSLRVTVVLNSLSLSIYLYYECFVDHITNKTKQKIKLKSSSGFCKCSNVALSPQQHA